MTCDIVIPVHNQLEYTKTCLGSIKKYTQYPHRIIIVDDASDRETQEYLGNLNNKQEIFLIRNETNLGWLKSANKGLSQAKAEYICLMNNDTVVTEGWLEEMINIAEKEKDIGLINPSWEKPNRASLDNYARNIKKFRGQYIETDWARGFCILIKREVIDKIGYFDEVYSPGYFDDHDFSVRAIKKGFRCLRSRASFVWHYRNITFQEKLKNEAFNRVFERNRKIFYQKWGRPLRIVFILQGLSQEVYQRLNQFFINLARDQNRVYILCKGQTAFSSHDNIFKIKIPNWLFSLGALFFIWDNSHRNPAKHYNLILISPSNLKKFPLQFSFLRKYEILSFDFSNPETYELILKIVKKKKVYGAQSQLLT
ncbi:MAG: hypothetical protein DRP74_08865 [Candidatus Omnitrophota bacterium]|nr:MAG: hypothetical protein DRP74_08865 [Candidatus Omnitrophota bacterium]